MSNGVKAGIPCVAAVAVLLAGCIGQSPIEPTSSAWSATLEPVGGATLLSGRVAAVAQHRRTFAEAEIAGGDPGTAYSWEIRVGSCASGGATFGSPAAYGGLTAGATGDASAQVTLGEQLQSTGTYHVVVRQGAAGSPPLACGELARRTFVAG